MKTLIITAHPSSKGFTHVIAESYKKGAEIVGKEVTLVDLYKTEWRQEYLIFEDIKEIPRDEKRDKIQKMINESEELVFIFPLWWMDAPAIMKNFFDTNFLAHYAYQYTGPGKTQGLLNGKTAQIFVTCDASKYKYWLIAMPTMSIWCLARLNFCGIKVKNFKCLDKMIFRSDKEKEQWAQMVEKIAKK